MSECLIWFQLADATGQPLQRVCPTSASVPITTMIDPFKHIIKHLNSNQLASFDAAQLVIYTNKQAFDEKKDPLKEDVIVSTLTTSRDECLLVLVPCPFQKEDALMNKHLEALNQVRVETLEQIAIFSHQVVRLHAHRTSYLDGLNGILDRQKQRQKEGFIDSSHRPESQPGFHSLPPFEQYQKQENFKRHCIEAQEDQLWLQRNGGPPHHHHCESAKSVLNDLHMFYDDVSRFFSEQ